MAQRHMGMPPCFQEWRRLFFRSHRIVNNMILSLKQQNSVPGGVFVPASLRRHVYDTCEDTNTSSQTHRIISFAKPMRKTPIAAKAYLVLVSTVAFSKRKRMQGCIEPIAA